MNVSEPQRGERSTDLRYVNVLDYLVVITKHSKFLLRFVVGCVLLTVIILWLFMSKWYKATSVIIPPKQKNTLGLLSSVMRSSTSPLRSLGLAGGGSDDLSQFQTILKSRRCLDAVVDRFDLMKVYNAKIRGDARKELEENLTVAMGKEEVSLEVSLYDTDRQRVADMANFFVETLNKIYLEISVAEAKSNREFLELRYRQNLRDLKNAEDSLKIFQKRFGIYSVPDQMKAAIEAAGAIESQIALKEIQLGILEKTTTPNNELREQTLLELTALRHQMSTLQFGQTGKSDRFQVFPPFDKAPELGVQYFRLYREVELQGKILELILPLFEQAKIEEQRDTPSVLVLDSAVPPELASKPRRLLVTAIVLLVSIIIGTVLTFFVESWQTGRSKRLEEDRVKIDQIWKSLNLTRWFASRRR